MKQAISRILVPMDYSEPAFDAAWMALAIARSLNASLTFVHVHVRENAVRESMRIDSGELADLNEERFESTLTRLVGDPSAEQLEARAPENAEVEMEPSSSSRSKEICSFAADNDIDLIVMGAHDGTPVGELFVGNITTEVLRCAPCAVTVVH